MNQAESEHKHNFPTNILSEITIFVALATALSLIVVYTLPQGGSITAGSMVPIVWLALRRGPRIGVFAGAIYGLIQFAILPYIAPTQWAPVQVLLDYPFAFGVLGLAGFFKKLPLVGATIGIVGRFIMHFVAGVFFWAPSSAPGADPYVFSAVYNGSYLIPELAVTALIIFFLQRSKVLNIYL